MDKNSILLYNNIILKVKVMLTTHFLDGACFNNNKKKNNQRIQISNAKLSNNLFIFGITSTTSRRII